MLAVGGWGELLFQLLFVELDLRLNLPQPLLPVFQTSIFQLEFFDQLYLILSFSHYRLFKLIYLAIQALESQF